MSPRNAVGASVLDGHILALDVVARAEDDAETARCEWADMRPAPTIEAIKKAIEAARGNKSEAARRLNITNGYLHRRLKEQKA